MPAHTEEQQNKLELCKNAIVTDMEKQNLKKYWPGTEIYSNKIWASLSKNS